MHSFRRFDTFEPKVLFRFFLRKASHMLRFDDLTNLNCSPFLEFDTFGAILARIFFDFLKISHVDVLVILIQKFQKFKYFCLGPSVARSRPIPGLESLGRRSVLRRSGMQSKFQN